mgnify:FL=1
MGTATVSCKDAVEGMTGAGSVSQLAEAEAKAGPLTTEAKAVSLLAGTEAKAVSLTEDNKVSAQSANWDCAAAMPDGIADKIMTKALIFPNFINLYSQRNLQNDYKFKKKCVYKKKIVNLCPICRT